MSPLAGVLSYLVPGLGQIAQGRIAKGLLFLVCIYTLFFYGMYLRAGAVTIGARTYRLSSNVYLPDTADDSGKESSVPRLLVNLYNRPQFAGQFWVGVAAWPAVWQYLTYDKTASHEADQQIDRMYDEADRSKERADSSKAKIDIEEADLKRQEAEERERLERQRHPLLGDFQREPSSSSINAVQNASDKRMELAWVYTVIAGVLNIMVIYDAVAGPAFLDPGAEDKKVE